MISFDVITPNWIRINFDLSETKNCWIDIYKEKEDGCIKSNIKNTTKLYNLSLNDVLMLKDVFRHAAKIINNFEYYVKRFK